MNNCTIMSPHPIFKANAILNRNASASSIILKRNVVLGKPKKMNQLSRQTSKKHFDSTCSTWEKEVKTSDILKNNTMNDMKFQFICSRAVNMKKSKTLRPNTYNKHCVMNGNEVYKVVNHRKGLSEIVKNTNK